VAAAQSATLDHFKCYKAATAKGTPKFETTTVTLVDALESKLTDVTKPLRICNAVSKDGSVIQDSTAHLECYKIKDTKTDPKQTKFGGATAATVNQFGSETLTVKQPEVVCVPSATNGQPAPVNLDHFKCYKANTAKGTPKFETTTVGLADEFETKNTEVTTPFSVCTAADKDGGGISDSAASFECYKIKDVKGQTKFAARDVEVQNQFGTETVTAKKAELLCVPSAVDLGGCDTSGITTSSYMIAFHACTSNCGNPQNHTIYLAGSNDGVTWSLISAFAGRAGSVPDLVFFNRYLYLFHAAGAESWVKMNACFEVVETGSVALVSAEDTAGYVDPSLVAAGLDLTLFYLPGIFGADPAGCTSYPCTKKIHSATADDTTLTSFTQVTGDRVALTIASGVLSDPDIVAKSDGTYALYVSAGPSTYVFTSPTVDGTFTSPDGSTPRAISNNSGGVPSALQAPYGQIWLYVTKNQSGVEVLRRGVSADGITPISDAQFATVIDHSISAGFTSATSVSSPSIIPWPDSTWSRQQ